MRIVSQFLALTAGCGVFWSGNRGGEEEPDSLYSNTRADPGSAHVLTMSSLFLPGGVDPPPSQDLYPIYLVLAGIGILAFLGVGMVAARKRRHEHGRLWLPEGFKTTETSKKKRREPVGEDSVGLK